MSYLFCSFPEDTMYLFSQPRWFKDPDIRTVGQNHSVYPVINTVSCPYEKIPVFPAGNFFFPKAVINPLRYRLRRHPLPRRGNCGL